MLILRLLKMGVMLMNYKLIWNYSDNETVEIINLLSNETLYSGSTDHIPNLLEFKSYVISKITLENYDEFLNEYDLDWDERSEPQTCSQCGSWIQDMSGEAFGIKYDYSNGCHGEYLTIHADSNESLQDFITKLNLHINAFVFGSRGIGEMDYESYTDEDVDVWSI